MSENSEGGPYSHRTYCDPSRGRGCAIDVPALMTGTLRTCAAHSAAARSLILIVA